MNAPNRPIDKLIKHPSSTVSNEVEPPMEEKNEMIPIAMTLWSYPLVLFIAICAAAIYFALSFKSSDDVPSTPETTKIESMTPR